VLLAAGAFSQGKMPDPTPTPAGNTDLVQPSASPRVLTLNDAIDLSLKVPSAYASSRINESIVKEDILQAKTAFLPKAAAPLNFIYTSPSLGPTRPRPPSFLGANAVTEYQALVTFAGEIDTSGKLKATLDRNKALLESARAGSEVAKRDLIQAVTEAYYGLALSAANRDGALSNLDSAEKFESVTKLNLDAGEVAPIDLTRARLQTQARRDELAQASLDEKINANLLRFLTGIDVSEPISTIDLRLQMPVDGEIERSSQAAISLRPEFAQFAADKRAAEKDVNIARREKRPQLTYSVSGGFISDSLAPLRIRDQAGIQATVGFTIPIFDWGTAHSKEVQAKLKLQETENRRLAAERQFGMEFLNARESALSARERIRDLSASLRDAEANVETATARYRAGETVITEVVDAQNLYVTQKRALFKAIFDYQIARSRLTRAVGE